MIDWFKKRKMILRWKLILWSFVCINFGAFMFTVDLNLFTIAFGMLFILWGGGWDQDHADVWGGQYRARTCCCFSSCGWYCSQMPRSASSASFTARSASARSSLVSPPSARSNALSSASPESSIGGEYGGMGARRDDGDEMRCYSGLPANSCMYHRSKGKNART